MNGAGPDAVDGASALGAIEVPEAPLGRVPATINEPRRQARQGPKSRRREKQRAYAVVVHP
ncbi:MAG: hypothetical protein M5U09_07950 [Gammaproteobacteria bacterium]|nr:hypothetical protein [Gammaproteobacteria bacterium]